PSSREALLGYDFSWYQDVTHALATQGFTSPAAYEPTSWMSRPVESRVLVEYALGDDGTVVVSWFANGGTKTPREPGQVSAFTLFEDGTTFDTVVGGMSNPLPMLVTEYDEYLPPGTSVAQLITRHRARVAAHTGTPRRFESVGAYLVNRMERSKRRRAYRQGLGLSLVEQYIKTRFTGDRAEVGEAYLDAIRKHPEWYKYANGNPDAARTASNGANRKQEESRSTPPAPRKEGSTEPAAKQVRDLLPTMPIRFLMSETEDGRRTLTTFGVFFSGVPELLLREIAANHCRAARVLVGTVATGLNRHRSAISNEAEFLAQLVSERGARITITRADAIAAGVTNVGDARGGASVEVHLALRGFTPEDEAALLLVNPLPDESSSFDERLREACARLGVEVPAARGVDTRDEAMHLAHERAVTQLDEVRARWKTRAASEEKVLVKFRATKGERGEYVWLEVRDWQDGVLHGEVVTPAPRVGLARHQPTTIQQAQIYDHLVMGPSGAVVPALTD
ncbi:MAG TPA: hypothetical protein VF488_05035, partial [Gemmatimonadaceae bacterium]